MNDLIKAAVSSVFGPLIDLIPNKNERARAIEEAEARMVQAVTGLVEGQLRINMKEAEHASIFVAGWRPAIGWICGTALAWNYIIQPIISWGAFLFGFDLADAPRLETAELTTILLGMLGLGGLRTYEKRIGAARTAIKGRAQ